MDSEAVQSPAPGLGATGVDDLDRISLGDIQEPGDVRRGVLDLLVLEVLHHEPVVPEHGVGALVDDGSVFDLFMHVPCIERRHRRFHAGGVPHPGIFVPGLEGGGNGKPSRHPLHAALGGIRE
jgi:hypothetical protein